MQPDESDREHFQQRNCSFLHLKVILKESVEGADRRQHVQSEKSTLRPVVPFFFHKVYCKFRIKIIYQSKAKIHFHCHLQYLCREVVREANTLKYSLKSSCLIEVV